MDSRTRRQPTQAHPHAFSLIELLIVVGIIVILISISLAVGFRVSGSGKVRQTEQTLRTLDQSLSEMIAKLGGTNPKPYVVDPRPANVAQTNPANQFVQPIIDGVNESYPDPTEPSGYTTVNSVGLYIAQCREIPAVFATIQGLPPKILKDYDADANGNDGDRRGQTSLLTVFDGWGNPVRYVHPSFSGNYPTNGAATFVPVFTNNGTGILKAPPLVDSVQRTFGIDSVRRLGYPDGTDADGGFTPGNRPYFYSCGPDGKPETIEDNVYINQPTYSKQ